MLSGTEWLYLLDHALTKNSSGEYDFTIAGHKCAILKPDEYTGTVADTYNATEWAAAEANGLVAFPFAGCRIGSFITSENCGAELWSSAPMPGGSGGACHALVSADVTTMNYGLRFLGHSVRLISII